MDAAKWFALKPGEEVLALVRGSLIPLWSKILLAFIWLVLPFFLLFPLFHMHLIGVIIFFTLLFSGMVYAFRFYVSWHETVMIITDLRIVDVDRPGLFGHVVSEVRYDQIRDASYRIRGVWPTLFHYGTLTIQVSGSKIHLEVYNVRHPQKAHDLINDLRHAEIH